MCYAVAPGERRHQHRRSIALPGRSPGPLTDSAGVSNVDGPWKVQKLAQKDVQDVKGGRGNQVRE